MPRILVVEDERAIRSLIILTLRQDGHRIEEAEDGTTAWERLQTDPPDLLLLDLRLPRLGGIELLQRLQANGGLPCPVIVMTAYTLSPLDRHVLDGLPLLRKPFDPEELMHLVRETVGVQRSQRR